MTDEPRTEINREVAEDAAEEFFELLMAIKKITSKKSFKKRGIFRSIEMALLPEVTDKRVRVTSKDELTVAMAFRKVVERWLIMKAQLIQEAKENESVREEESMAEDRNDSKE